MQSLEAGVDRPGAMMSVEFLETPRGDVVGGELGKDVSLALLAPAQVGEHEIDRVALGALGREEAKRRDPEPFLV